MQNYFYYKSVTSRWRGGALEEIRSMHMLESVVDMLRGESVLVILE